ncbi:nucleoside-diphosphate kinase [Candidatus Woesearchaeota archaeon]|nr:nucleoside-diphosphate kinase [Candidatus Woesearchaeota archaeon]
MIERSLVLIKPDGVQRALLGKIISRFEDVGLKIIGMKMMQIDEAFAKKHYFDVAQRRGEAVLQRMLKVLTEGPVVAMVLEGLHAPEIVRKMVGATEPRTAAPGTIRGDFAMHSFEHTDREQRGVKNTVHASGNAQEAEIEIALWFKKNELYNYKNVHEAHTF